MIRAATPADAGLLSAIHRDCFPHYWNVDAFNDFFQVVNSFGLVAEEPQPIGMIVCRVQHEQADIMTMGVRPEWRKKGIGRALLEKALVQAAELGAQIMFLDVEEGNASALKLYESQGFTHVRRRRQYYRQKDGSFMDALVMQRKLG